MSMLRLDASASPNAITPGLAGSLFVAAAGVSPRIQPAAGGQPTGGSEGLFGVPYCGQVESPGVAQDDLSLIDYSELAGATIDQHCIENVLETLDLRDRDVLHVGIGSSSLALRFHGRCRSIDGITISQRELDRAKALQLPNYRAMFLNKYDSRLAGTLARTYDLIIDNNLASFACCGFHLLLMFNNYRLMLKADGRILTDQQGMDWVVKDPRWRLGYADLAAIGQRLSMGVARITDTVYAMIRP